MKAWLAVLPITIAMPTAAWAQKTTESARDAELVCQLAGLCGDEAQAEADRKKSRLVLFPERDVPPPTGLAAYRDCVFRMVEFFASASERQPPAREKVRKALIQCEHLKIAMHVQDLKDTQARTLNYRRRAGIMSDHIDPAVTELEVRQRIHVAERLAWHEALERLVGKLPSYEFKGIPLDLSLDDFRQLRHPDAIDPATVACRGNAIATPAGTPEVPDVKLQFLSIVMALGPQTAPVRCAWFGNGELLPLHVTRLRDPSWRYSFYFYPIGGVNFFSQAIGDLGDLRLSEIVLRGPSTSVPELAAEFESKYGEPWLNARVVYAEDGWTTRRAWVWIGPELDGSVGDRKIRSQIELIDNNPSNGNFQMRMLLYEIPLEGETWRVPGA